MTISESELNTLHQLVTQDKALLAQVQEAVTAQELVQIIAQAARTHGLSVSSEALLSYIENAARHPPGTELTEAQLADVAGGITLNFISPLPESGITLFQRGGRSNPMNWSPPPSRLSWPNEPSLPSEYNMQIQK